MSKTDAALIAEALHELICIWDHTEGCSWHYESWENPGYARKRYLRAARNLLEEEWTATEVLNLVDAVKDGLAG